MTSLATMVMFRNGWPPSLLIDGHCRYYASKLVTHMYMYEVSAPTLSAVHTGQLSPERLAQLTDDLHYADWGKLNASITVNTAVPATGIPAPGGTLTDGERFLECWGACTDGSGSIAVNDLFGKAYDWVTTLYEEGEPLSGPVRIVVEAPSGAGSLQRGAPAMWPLSRPVADFAIPADGGNKSPSIADDSHVVDEPDASLLRTLREQQVDGAFTPWWMPGGPALPVSESPNGTVYSLTVSDVLPYEDDQGHLAIWTSLFHR